jgi:hypothetical protein
LNLAYTSGLDACFQYFELAIEDDIGWINSLVDGQTYSVDPGVIPFESQLSQVSPAAPYIALKSKVK